MTVTTINKNSISKSVLFLLSGVALMLFAVFPDSIPLMAVCFIFSGILLSFAVSFLDKKYFALWQAVILIVSCGVAIFYHFVFHMTLLQSALAFIPTLLCFYLSYAVYLKLTAKSLVIVGAVFVFLIGIAIFLAFLYSKYGEINNSLFEKFYAKVTDKQFYIDRLNQITASSGSVSQIDDAVSSVYDEISENDFKSVVNLLITLTPSLYIAICISVSYFINLLHSFITKISNAPYAVTDRKISMSRAAAFVFFISFLISMITSTSPDNFSQIVYLVALSIGIIFIPGFALVGIRNYRLKLKRPSLFTYITIIILGFMLFSFPPFSIYMIAVIGMIDTIFAKNFNRLYK